MNRQNRVGLWQMSSQYSDDRSEMRTAYHTSLLGTAR